MRVVRLLDRPVSRYTWAICVVAAAALLRSAMVRMLGQQLAPYLTFYPAVMLVAILGGFWPGILSVILSAGFVDYAILPPVGHFGVHGAADIVSLGFFVLMGLLICLLAERYRISQGALADASAELRAKETAERLAQSEAKFQLIANSIPQLCWMADPDGSISWYNTRWCTYTGTTPDQMLGWGWQSVHDPAALALVTERWKESISTGAPFDMVFPLRRHDGVFRLFLTRVSPSKDADGKVLNWFGTNTDIDDQQKDEAKLQSTNERLDMALDAAGLGEWELDPVTRFATRSIRHAQLFGYKSLEPGWNFELFLEHVLPEHRAEVSEAFSSSFKTGVLDFEARIRRADGQIRSIWTRGRHKVDAAGKPTRLYGTVMDITDRKRAENALKISEAQLQLFVEHTPAAVAMFDKEMRYLVVTRRWQNDYQLGEGDLQGVSHYDLLPWTREARGDLHRRAIGGEVIVNDGEPFILKDGTSIWLRWEMRPWFDLDGSIGGMLMFTEDITARKRSEDVLKDSETQLRLFVEQAPVALAMFDHGMRYIVASQRWMVNNELEGQDVSGQSHYDLCHWMPDNWRDSHVRGLAGEVVTSEDDLLQRPNKSDQWIRWAVQPWRDASGMIGGVLIFAEDITERKLTEQKLQHITRIYSVLSDINQTVVREKDSRVMLQAACDIAVNKGLFRMAWIGMIDPAAREVMPLTHSGTFNDYVSGLRINLDAEQSVRGPATRCVRSGERAVCNDIENDPAYAPWREPALQRGYRSSAAFPIKAYGEVIGVFNLYSGEPGFFSDQELVVLDEMALDISYALEVNQHEAERQKVEDELRWRTAFFEAQMESTLDGIMVKDDRGHVIFKNAQFAKLWKMPREIADNPSESVQVDYAISMAKDPEQFIKNTKVIYAHPDQPSQDELELLDGTILTRFTSPVKDSSGKDYGRIWVFQDITKRRQLEQQLRQSQKMEAVGQLTGGIAHDFNNLLGVILGNLDLLQELVKGDAAALRRVQTAQRAAERGADVTRRLLAFSRDGELKPVLTDLNASVREVVELARTLGPDIKFLTNVDETASPVFVDAAGLESALLNLVVNARDAMPNGGSLTISTELRRLDASYPLVEIGELTAGTFASISVTDTGSGMSKETLDRVFEPFFTTKSEGKGTGLGLAMVYGFVKQSGGAVRIYSEVGVGTTVTIYLPVANAVPLQTVPVEPVPMSTGRQGKVLVVDDEPDLIEITAIYLERMGYQVYEASDAIAAIEVARREIGLDLMITDIIMPGGVNGVELAYKVRELLPHIKIIYSSGFPANAMADRGLPKLDAPMLRKPYHLEEFEAAVRLATG